MKMFGNQSIKTKYFKESIRNNFIIGTICFAIVGVNYFMLKWPIKISILLMVMGSYKLIIGGINYISYKKGESNFLKNKKL